MGKKIPVVINKQRFQSISDAARYYQVSSSTMRKRINLYNKHQITLEQLTKFGLFIPKSQLK